MASGFIAIAIAHDYTCPKGEEWVFHGIPKSDEKESDKKGDDKDDDVDFMPLGIGCLTIVLIVGLVVFGVWAIWG